MGCNTRYWNRSLFCFFLNDLNATVVLFIFRKQKNLFLGEKFSLRVSATAVVPQRVLVGLAKVKSFSK